MTGAIQLKRRTKYQYNIARHRATDSLEVLRSLSVRFSTRKKLKLFESIDRRMIAIQRTKSKIIKRIELVPLETEYKNSNYSFWEFKTNLTKSVGLIDQMKKKTNHEFKKREKSTNERLN